MQENISPTTQLPSENNLDREKLQNPIIPIVVILGIILVVTLAYIAYQNVQLTQRVSDLEAELTQNKIAVKIEEDAAMPETKESSPITSLSELTTDSTWERKVYSSNEQVLWDVQQPVGTTSNENGLIEGYLGLTVPYKDYLLLVELSYPRLGEEPPYPESLDEWITWTFDNMHLGTVTVKQPILDHLVTLNKTETTEVKMISGIGIMDGDKNNTQMPVAFVFKWSESGSGPNRFHPNMIMVKSANNQVVPSNIIEEFTQTFAEGIRWIQ